MRRGVHDEELNTRVLWPSVYSARYINIYFTANSKSAAKSVKHEIFTTGRRGIFRGPPSEDLQLEVIR